MKRRSFLAGLAMACAAVGAISVGAAKAKSLDERNAQADATLKLLAQTEPVSTETVKKTKGALIFPEILKGGFVIGAAAGRGVLCVNGKHQGVRQSAAVSDGLQAGIEGTRISKVAE